MKIFSENIKKSTKFDRSFQIFIKKYELCHEFFRIYFNKINMTNIIQDWDEKLKNKNEKRNINFCYKNAFNFIPYSLVNFNSSGLQCLRISIPTDFNSSGFQFQRTSIPADFKWAAKFLSSKQFNKP